MIEQRDRHRHEHHRDVHHQRDDEHDEHDEHEHHDAGRSSASVAFDRCRDPSELKESAKWGCCTDANRSWQTAPCASCRPGGSIDENGRPIRESTRTTKETVARRILRSREGDVEHGIPINPKMGRVTLEEAADDILNDYRANHRRSLDGVDRRLRLHLRPYFAGVSWCRLRPRTYAPMSRSERRT